MTPLLTRLREETQPLHKQTEARLYADPLRLGTLTPPQYLHLLRLHGAFHQALETAIDQYPLFFAHYQPATRQKTPWLQADLARADQTIPTIPGLFADWTPDALLGAAYVGEGSMLGGKTVWHYLQQSPALAPLLEHARFYRGYGADTGAQWRAFSAFVANQPADPEAVIDGAKQAFRLYQTLFERTQLA